MAEDLFGAAADERRAARAPLAARLRPTTIDRVVGQTHLLGPGQPLRALIESDRLSSIVLWGPPGTGKTTLARLIASHTAKAFEQLSAVTAKVADVRDVIATARHRLGERGDDTILFLDEIHRFNKAQQDTLLPAVEDGTIVLVGATTENPYFSLNAPLRSRSVLFRLEPLGPDALTELARRGLESEGFEATDDAVALLVDRAGGDGRQLLAALEVAIGIAGGPRVTQADAEAALGAASLRYGVDDHYDAISAFIKALRGSDVDAGLYWLARMLEAGEDARFVARRMVILASEDVGMADPMALMVATAAAQAVEFVGLPEAQLNLAQAVVHLATAPKSNRSAVALWAAQEAVRTRPPGEVPPHLRGTGYPGAQDLGHGVGYRYPHDDPRGWVPQQYRPDGVTDRYYEPSAHGHEQEIADRMARTAEPDPDEGPGATEEGS